MIPIDITFKFKFVHHLTIGGGGISLYLDDDKGVKMQIDTRKGIKYIIYKIDETKEQFEDYNQMVDSYKKTLSYYRALLKIV